jgi:cellobiose phosphorylase
MTMNEGMYLDAMNQLKEMNEKREKETEKHKQELLNLKKELISAYGIVRLIDMMYSDADEPIGEISLLIETLREYLSQFVENKIICQVNTIE